MKIYEVDPLTCPQCGGNMRIIAFIEDCKVVKKILDYLGIYEFERKRPPPQINTLTDEFDDYIDCDHVCQVGYKVAGYLATIKLAWI